jgi:hypothetical protein
MLILRAIGASLQRFFHYNTAWAKPQLEFLLTRTTKTASIPAFAAEPAKNFGVVSNMMH